METKSLSLIPTRTVLWGLPANSNSLFKRRHISLSHIAGKEISSKRIKPIFKNSPKVLYSNKEIDMLIYTFIQNNFLNFYQKIIKMS